MTLIPPTGPCKSAWDGLWLEDGEDGNNDGEPTELGEIFQGLVEDWEASNGKCSANYKVCGNRFV